LFLRRGHIVQFTVVSRSKLSSDSAKLSELELAEAQAQGRAMMLEQAIS